MDTPTIASVRTVKFLAPSRILRSSWCPDKDLVAVVARVGGEDKLSLWPMQGPKKWEVDTKKQSAGGEEIIAISWSPDGQYIAVAQQPPAISLYSLQDGRQERTIPVPSHPSLDHRLTGIWWFKEDRAEKEPSMPDLFKRQNDITGSAHSILRTQPLLDPLHDDSQQLSALELFAFQGNRTRPTARSQIPSEISSWPMLPADPLAASLQSVSAANHEHRPGEELDEVDDSNVNSVLVVSDDSGNLHGFLDGSYPLGTIAVVSGYSVVSLFKQNNATFFLNVTKMASDSSRHTVLRPAILRIPFLQRRLLRDIARTSTSARELSWYIMRVIKEMRSAWFGADTHHGAREIGPNWLRALEQRQRQQFGVEEPNAVLDLTVLLTTGRISESVSDFLGSGEHMSERGIQKWESSVSEALIKLRDYASKRVAPACQRLHILLQEVQGWAQLPQYALCEFRSEEIAICLDLVGRAIVCASWLVATARRELARFKEFISWLRYESVRAANSNVADATSHPSPKHDILEVNEYLMSGLVVSSIDKWFMGLVPKFSPADLGVPAAEELTSSIRVAQQILRSPEGLIWPPNSRQQDLSRLDRNLDSLMQELSMKCCRIFNEASKATSRSATVAFGQTPASLEISGVEQRLETPLFVRERTSNDTTKVNYLSQHLLIQTPRADGESYLCLVRTHDKDLPSIPAQSLDVAALKCCATVEDEEGMVSVEVLDAEFFDENILVIVFRPSDRGRGPTYIATIDYTNLVYENIEPTLLPNGTREGLMSTVLQLLKDGQIVSAHLPILQSRALVGCREGNVTLAVNGRVGRRVACVLDDAGLALEILDMEGDADEEEEGMEIGEE